MNDVDQTADRLELSRASSPHGSALLSVWSFRALRLLPGVVLLLFWEWASGRLIREIYVSVARKQDAWEARVFFATGL